MFAAVSVRMRKTEKGTSGASTRSSQATKAARITPESASRPIVRPVAQPTSGAFAIAYTSSASPPVTASAPLASNRRCPRSAWLSGTIGRVSVPVGMVRSVETA